jgi:D-3-phosphoglycerate dehydrogenase
VVLAASLESDKPIVDRAAIDALDGRYFVNIARGELLDEDALLTAVEGGRLAGCAIDVIRNENGLNNHEHWIAATRSRNVIVTPHIGGATYASMRATEEFIADKLAALLATDSAPKRSSQ